MLEGWLDCNLKSAIQYALEDPKNDGTTLVDRGLERETKME